ncbi:BRO-N domain-containing protein [Magnetococcus sp. PR-3]|uniref:BRO-N domain-containing protein n=1 Tax=Magnetococcus sp. PR-3 TaxID=3120355 RepID=UPI002FCE5F2E
MNPHKAVGDHVKDGHVTKRYVLTATGDDDPKDLVELITRKAPAPSTSHEIRVHLSAALDDESGEPWFHAGDVCGVLGYGEVTNNLKQHTDGVNTKKFRAQNSRGQMREAWFVNEEGLYDLIAGSKKPNARKFRKWVHGTVLPSIRKDGGYIDGQEKVVTGEPRSQEEMAMYDQGGSHEVRIHMDKDDQPWFHAGDVCGVLGYTNSRMEVKHHCEAEDVKKFYALDKRGCEQLTNFVNEAGLNDLILDSEKPAAKEFRRWVTKTVLPSIRKNGQYTDGQEKVVTGEMTPAELMAKAVLAANQTLADLQNEKRQLEQERCKNALLKAKINAVNT